MEYDEASEAGASLPKSEPMCPKCKVPMEGGVCPICDMRAIDIEDEDEYNDRRERR